ncbi:hypothetical protein HMPREF3226_02445 [Prevotella corporis]|uniref:Uncharacterized protein n=1 Tax=Prevotella corporis TaxID=28128 RepID=A0A133PVI1_9BACT|nr:hypothetical protein HMPREF3226_02445 [Prevotella corporis]
MKAELPVKGIFKDKNNQTKLISGLKFSKTRIFGSLFLIKNFDRKVITISNVRWEFPPSHRHQRMSKRIVGDQ